MVKKSLGFKLTFGGIFLVVFPLLIVGYFSVEKASTALKKAKHREQVSVVTQISSITNLFLQKELRVAKEIAERNITVTTGTRVINEGLAQVSAESAALSADLKTTHRVIGEDYESIFVTDPSGTIFADSVDGKTRGIDLSTREYFKMAENGTASVGSVVKSRSTGAPIVVASAPIMTKNNQFAGLVGIAVNIDFLMDQIASVKMGETGYGYMIDGDGLFIAHPNSTFILQVNLKEIDGLEEVAKNMIAGKTGVSEYVYQNVAKITGYAPVPITGWSVGVTQPTKELFSPVSSLRNVILLTGSFFLALTIFGVLYFARSITIPINRIIENLTGGSDKVAEASKKASAAGQSLAEGATEQAASVEETSSALEVISSMTRQNADIAAQADSLMRQARQLVEEANASMEELNESMGEISKASDEVSKINKTIDEIAFQTNLLALNAAVEAARAGDAGAGFSVVADEVRNLALRASDAAKNTAELIDGAVKRIQSGTILTATTSDKFNKVAENAKKVADLVGDIATNSNEQSKDVRQVTAAVEQMDSITQQNAGNAEEFASSSEELKVQADQMNMMIDELNALVRGITKNGVFALEAPRPASSVRRIIGSDKVKRIP